MKQYINGIEVKSTNYKKYAALLDAYRHAVNAHGNIRPTSELNGAFNTAAQKADTPEKCKDLLNAYVKEVLSNV